MIIIILGAIGLDQTTKTIAKRELANNPAISMFADLFRLQYTENTGAFLSLGSNLSGLISFFVLMIFPVIILILLLVYILLSKKINIPQIIGFCFIIGGGASNLLDRFLYHRAVVDFMNFGIGTLRTGILNVADLFITTGFIILIMDIFLLNKEKNIKKTTH
jgi:signal peptidase II